MTDEITEAQSKDEDLRGRGLTPYIVGVNKRDPSEHDVYDQYADPALFYEIDSELRPLGDDVVYGQYLDEDGYEAFKTSVDSPGTNGNYIEEDVLDTFPAMDEAGAMEEAAELHQGTDKRALEALGFLAEDKYEPRGRNVLVGVGDTGTYTDRQYIARRLVANWDWVGDYGKHDGWDHNGHGAWCTGAALAPRARLVNGKVMDRNGSGYRSHVIAFWRQFADFCQAQGKLGVASLSLGAEGRSEAYDDASRYAISKSVITVAATGNSNTSPALTPAIEYGVIGVAATTLEMIRASFSNYGIGTDIAAPGVTLEGYSGVKSGTSMATPYVARLLCYLLSVRASTTQARAVLRESCQRYGQSQEAVGAGVPNVGKAMTKMGG
jgi:subtilisin family serine protease